MKKVFSLLLIGVLLLIMSGCGVLPQEEMEQTLASFTDALKIYDREQMTVLLTAFPNNSDYVYYDDIFNDEEYMEMYRILFSDIVYTVQSSAKNQLTVSFTMPNVQKIYSEMFALVMQLALEDENLMNKLSENDVNGSILVREMMLAYAKQGNEPEQMNEEFTLSFDRKDGKMVLVCDDELRALMTGNFFLSKNSTQEEIHLSD